MLMNNKFNAQTLTGNPTGNLLCHVLASHALNMSCSFGQSARSIESRWVVNHHVYHLQYYDMMARWKTRSCCDTAVRKLELWWLSNQTMIQDKIFHKNGQWPSSRFPELDCFACYIRCCFQMHRTSYNAQRTSDLSATRQIYEKMGYIFHRQKVGLFFNV